MDAFGHVNNTVYIRYMEIARIEWLREFDAMSETADTGPVVVNVFCNFLRQVTFPGTLKVSQALGRPGRSSFDLYTRMERTDAPGEVVATGGATVVWIDRRQGNSVPLPEALLASFAQL